MSVWLWLLACGGDGAPKDTGEVSISEDTGIHTPCTQGWDEWANGFFTTYCRSCHSATSANRHNAPEGINFDTLDDTLGLLDRVRVRVIEAETMPVGGGVPADALIRLDDWLRCQGEAR